jgi:hypothetical protein
MAINATQRNGPRPPGVSERDLRRAYARLIRAYKPEQFPEHFRRIREAYEAAQRYAQYFSVFEAAADSPVQAAESPPTPEQTPATPEGGATGTPAERLLSSLEEELDAAWSYAVEGDEARAYASLLDLQSRHAERSDVCLRLYCLLKVAPGLDAGRTPCDFLAQGLRQTGGSGPCHELCRREIEDNPDEALTERFAELLSTTTQPGLLATLVQWRWTAAGRLGRFEVIENDLPDLRARLAGDQEEIWLRLVAAAADRLAWAPPRTNSAGLAECLREAARHEHLQLRCADVFDRLELLERAASGWHALRKQGTIPRDFLELLCSFWTRPFSEIRRSVTALLAAVAARTDFWLVQLDNVHHSSPHLLSLFGNMFDCYEWGRSRRTTTPATPQICLHWL